MNPFDPTIYYSLFEVFHRTGRAMYGHDWRGSEVWAKRYGDPLQSAKERKAINVEVDALLDVLIPLERRNIDGRSNDEKREIEDRRKDLSQRIDILEKRRLELPIVDASDIADHAGYTRRVAVEHELRRAFAAEELFITISDSSRLIWNAEVERRSFQIYFDLSMVRMAWHSFGYPRRRPALIAKIEFDQWVERFPAHASLPTDRTVEVRVSEWLLDYVTRYARKPKSRQDFWLEAKDRFSELSERNFDAIWKATVPASWQKPGRIRTK